MCVCINVRMCSMHTNEIKVVDPLAIEVAWCKSVHMCPLSLSVYIYTFVTQNKLLLAEIGWNFMETLIITQQLINCIYFVHTVYVKRWKGEDEMKKQ